MQHTLRFRDDDTVLLEEHTLAYGLACGYERGATELGVPAGRQVQMELLDHGGHLLDWRTYQVAVTGGQFPDPAARSSPAASAEISLMQEGGQDQYRHVDGRQVAS